MLKKMHGAIIMKIRVKAGIAELLLHNDFLNLRRFVVIIHPALLLGGDEMVRIIGCQMPWPRRFSDMTFMLRNISIHAEAKCEDQEEGAGNFQP